MRDNLSFAFFFKWFECWQKLLSFDYIHFVCMIRINFTKSCRYFEVCYANSNMKLVKRNQKLHNPDSLLLLGEVKEGVTVKEISEPSYIDTQQRLI